MSVFDELTKRGMIAQCTDEEKVKELLEKEKITFYIGFDPTADSLHVGHFVAMMVMAHMQRAGHRPIALFGGGTGMIGDPSGKTDMRKMLTKEYIDHNISRFQQQMSKFIDFSDGKAIMVNNADWLLNLNYVDFLREIGVHFSVNRMLAAECYKQRLERGLTFFELNYMLMQSYDFLMLSRKYGCLMQLGGDDQWANIIGGVELNRRADGRDVYGLTVKLLTTSEGKKMGKTEKGAVWLDPEKTSPYDFYQYWRNIADADVINTMKILTFMPVDEIEQYANLKGAEINVAKERLAFEVTKLIHGEDEAEKAKQATKALFSGAGNTENTPSTEIKDAVGMSLLDVLAATGVCSSKSDARRNVQQGGVSINSIKITDVNYVISENDFKNNEMILKKGKKTYHRVVK
ncbi:MAG: tyrosine--tRNA ligase [Acutalibacteraceae bacterium]|nr:tyrosine--tRNA ligase [Acutalibacteraceae bacterium]